MPAVGDIRVMVAVEDPLMAIGFRTVLQEAEGIRCAPPPEDLASLRDHVAAEAPDVLVLDVKLRRADARLIPDLVGRQPSLRILVHVDHSARDCALQHLLELGERTRLSPEALSKLDDCCLTSLRQQAMGCLGTGAGRETVVKAVRSVAAGEVTAAPWLAALAETIHAPNGVKRAASPISARELEVMALLAEGLSNKEIARRLGLREQTVKNHVTRTMEKLGVRNRTEVGLLAARHNLRLVEDAPEA